MWRIGVVVMVTGLIAGGCASSARDEASADGTLTPGDYVTVIDGKPCGKTGTEKLVWNAHPDRIIIATVAETWGGHTFHHTLRIPPGATNWVGCSTGSTAPGEAEFEKDFAIRSARWSP